jgi:S-DNA-T family DNA segregation ATPase FtsK/SpoIIIE
MPQKRDALYESAVELVLREGGGSVSRLHHAFSIGFGRAFRIVDSMKKDGILGEYVHENSPPYACLFTRK